VKFLIWILLAYLGYRMLRGKKSPELPTKQKVATETFQDPVCGVYVPEAEAVVGKLEGKRFYFCSMECLQQFEKLEQQKNRKAES
jgi:YHS domain-containing protein